MLKWAPYPFLRVAFFLSAGILTYFQWGNKPVIMLPFFALFFVLYLLCWFGARAKKSFDLYNLAGLAAMGAVYTAGYLLTHVHTLSYYRQNIVNVQEPVLYYEGVVDDYITHKPKTLGTTLSLNKIKTAQGWKPVMGKVRVSISKDNLAGGLTYGSVLVVKGAPERARPPLNPGQFDYRRYLANQQIYHQHYLSTGHYIITGYKPAFKLVAWSIHLRNFLDKKLRENIPSTREYAIATALVLGIKDYLPEDIKTTYSQTGTMHVLAVSGLHVALLFGMLNLLTGKLRQRKGYRVLGFALALVFIWGYGFITALSASVMRAVVMFTIILIADTFQRQKNIYNTLAAAAFCLLLYNPYYLFDVGFQLSFLAVFGIVYFQPKIYHWLEFDVRIWDDGWKLVSTSLAAQLAVLPLSFYYFHQFPVYFLLANIPAIVLSEIALLLGFGVAAFGWWPTVAFAFGLGVQNVLALMNYCSAWLLKLPLAVIDGISITPSQTWLLYSMLLLLMVFFAQKQLKYFVYFTLLVLVFCSWRVADARNRKQQQYLVVYQVPKAIAIGFISGNRATLLADSAFYANPKTYQYSIQPHWVKAGINQTDFDTLGLKNQSGNQIATADLPDGNQLISWQGKRVLLCRRAFKKYMFESINPNYLVLANNAYLAPATLPNKNHHLLVILSGSNYNWYAKKMKALFAERNIVVHNLKEQGAFIIK